MFDPNFDPLERLELCLKNQHELARAYNDNFDTVKQLLHQNRQLNDMLKQARLELAQLKTDIEMLKAQPIKEIYHNTNYGNH